MEHVHLVVPQTKVVCVVEKEYAKMGNAIAYQATMAMIVLRGAASTWQDKTTLSNPYLFC